MRILTEALWEVVNGLSAASLVYYACRWLA